MRTFPAMLAAAIGLTLSGCQDTQSAASAAGETPIVISQQTWGYYQKYLRSGGPLAFAVSKDGYSAAYIYCEDGNCQQYNQARSEALSNCANISRQQCVIFAKWSQIVVPYEIASH